MASIDVVDIKNSKVGKLELADDVFGVDVRSDLMHSSVRVQLLNHRGGNACTKGRSDVRGGGAKPWKQKGTGRARSGTASSPIWVGGGAAFGPKPKEYSLTLNKKTKRAALRSALSMKFKDKDLIVLDDFQMKDPKTKSFVAVLDALKVRKTLLVLGSENDNVSLSSRNVRDVKVLRTEGLNVYDLLKYDKLLLTKDAVAKIEEVLVK
jgi:large subunit ribosomal protein L4